MRGSRDPTYAATRAAGLRTPPSRASHEVHLWSGPPLARVERFRFDMVLGVVALLRKARHSRQPDEHLPQLHALRYRLHEQHHKSLLRDK